MFGLNSSSDLSAADELMETPVEVEASTEPSAPAFSQVIFNNIPHSYPPSTSITCDYTLTAGLQPNSRDWVGIFKVRGKNIKFVV